MVELICTLGKIGLRAPSAHLLHKASHKSAYVYRPTSVERTRAPRQRQQHQSNRVLIYWITMTANERSIDYKTYTKMSESVRELYESEFITTSSWLVVSFLENERHSSSSVAF